MSDFRCFLFQCQIHYTGLFCTLNLTDSTLQTRLSLNNRPKPSIQFPDEIPMPSKCPPQPHPQQQHPEPAAQGTKKSRKKRGCRGGRKKNKNKNKSKTKDEQAVDSAGTSTVRQVRFWTSSHPNGSPERRRGDGQRFLWVRGKRIARVGHLFRARRLLCC